MHKEFKEFKESREVWGFENEFDDMTKVLWHGYALASSHCDWEESGMQELAEFLGQPPRMLMI